MSFLVESLNLLVLCVTPMIRMMLLRGEQCEHTLRQTIGTGDDSLKEKLR